MSEICNLTQYMNDFHFEEAALTLHPEIALYIEQQEKNLQEIIDNMTKDSFWADMPFILGIDSKLVLLRELFFLMDESDDTAEDFLSIVDNDYRYYNKELCGYRVTDIVSNSLIFKIR